MINISVIGCGFVADLYAQTLKHHNELALIGAYDTNARNLASFCTRWKAVPYNSLTHVLNDASVPLVLNLTNPRSHYDVTKRCLEAGKHVYSEKPLAMSSEQAMELVAIAERAGLYLGAAPCSLLSETAQTVWKALKDGDIGRPRLVYAEFEDGMIAPTLAPWNWRNECGVAWPAKDEFEVGCTYEHAGYVLTWLAAFFGPAKTVTSFASCQLPDKGIPVDVIVPDFSVGCIEYAEGVVVRVTCGLVAPRDKSFTIVGDAGVVWTNNVRDDAGPVFVKRIPPTRVQAAIESRVNRLRNCLAGWFQLPCLVNDWHFATKYPFARKPTNLVLSGIKPVDFCRGPSEMAEAIEQRRPCRLSSRLALHITEIVECFQYPDRYGGKRKLESTFEAIKPLPWTG